MKNITAELNDSVLDSLGIEVVDVRVKRIDLPQEVSSQVFRRMTAERDKEANELRSTGKERAEKIRASADRERTIEVANAYRDSEKLRGDTSAEPNPLQRGLGLGLGWLHHQRRLEPRLRR